MFVSHISLLKQIICLVMANHLPGFHVNRPTERKVLGNLKSKINNFFKVTNQTLRLAKKFSLSR